MVKIMFMDTKTVSKVFPWTLRFWLWFLKRCFKDAPFVVRKEREFWFSSEEAKHMYINMLHTQGFHDTIGFWCQPLNRNGLLYYKM